MADFSDPAIDEQLTGRNRRSTAMVWFDFRTKPLYLWPGFGEIRAPHRGKMRTWQGMGTLGSLTSAGFGVATVVEEMTFKLAGTDEILAAADGDAAELETEGRDVEVWLQFQDRRTDRDWQLLGDPILWFWGKMGVPEIGEELPDQDGTRQLSVSVTAQNVLVAHAKPPYGYFSDTDQRTRSYGGDDNLCLRMQEFVDGSVEWPRF